jgi:hypothetical protein
MLCHINVRYVIQYKFEELNFRSSIPRWLRNLIKQLETPQLPILIRYRVMQCMRPDIAPEPIDPKFRLGGSSTSSLKNPRGDSEAGVSGHDFGTSNFLCQFSTSTCSKGASIGAMRGIDGGESITSTVC